MFVTIYTHTVTRRKGPDAGKKVTIGCAYKTKSHTQFHRALRNVYPNAVTYENPKQVFTDLVPGLNLGTMPIVVGGTVVSRAGEQQ